MLFALTVVVAILLAWFGVPLMRQARAWRELERLRFESRDARPDAFFNFNVVAIRDVNVLEFDERTPAWLRTSQGPGLLATVTKAFIYASNEPESETFPLLAQLPYLHELYVDFDDGLVVPGRALTRSKLEHFARLRGLDVLTLRGLTFDDPFFETLDTLPNIREVTLNGRFEAANALGTLTKLPRLKSLTLRVHSFHAGDVAFDLTLSAEALTKLREPAVISRFLQMPRTLAEMRALIQAVPQARLRLYVRGTIPEADWPAWQAFADEFPNVAIQ